ncbi:MAG TPA: anti-phage ZorAB system protein ZorA [Rubrivivax sp.]|nr:anti-phage ZorAB system protein ZorA [Rubrivivax sp.]
MNYVDLVHKAPMALLVTGSALALLTLGFVFWFVTPAVLLRLRLGRVLRQLRSGEPRNAADLHKIFESDPRLLHLWKEFRDTLHAQREERDGQMLTTKVRATAPAESFFNSHAVVEGRLRTEFFKHLPGIFTGIGIIGTFSGLITGLRNFEVPEDPAKVRQSLELLLGGVFEAFIVSAAAITLAMVVTFIEKVLLSSLYRCTEDVAQHLDGLFAMGAGEEYLSRLVTASEDSAAQSKILKDSLVGDLKVLLQEMTERQIAAHQANSQALGQHITAGIETSLREPLKQIGEVVAKASGDQSAAAATLLQDVMASFSERLNDLFGGQISGIQELNQKSAQAMQDAVASLQGLLGRMEENSQRSGDVMAEKMARAVEEMERRQAEINEQTRSFVEGIRDMVSKSQSETNTKLNEAIGNLSEQMGAMMGALQAQAEKSHQEQQRREQCLTDRTKGMVNDLGASVAEVVKQMAASTDQMRQSVASLERTTTTSIDKLNSGARTLEQGATAFAQAGDKVTGALGRAASVADRMAEVSGALSSSSTALQNVLSDYRANREATGSMLTELRSVVESAKREASLTQQALDRIQTAATKLAQAHHETENYLEGVSDVLADAHAKFADGLSRTLDRANSDFHAKLSCAVKLLSSAVEELEVSLSGATPSRR